MTQHKSYQYEHEELAIRRCVGLQEPEKPVDQLARSENKS